MQVVKKLTINFLIVAHEQQIKQGAISFEIN